MGGVLWGVGGSGAQCFVHFDYTFISFVMVHICLLRFNSNSFNDFLPSFLSRKQTS